MGNEQCSDNCHQRLSLGLAFWRCQGLLWICLAASSLIPKMHLRKGAGLLTFKLTLWRRVLRGKI